MSISFVAERSSSFAPVVPGIEAEAEVILFGSHAKVRANLDIVGKREVVGALSTGEPHLAVDITITHVGTTANVKFASP